MKLTPHRSAVGRLMLAVLGSALILGLVVNAQSFMADGDWMTVLSPFLLGAMAMVAFVSIGLAVIFLFRFSQGLFRLISGRGPAYKTDPLSLE